MRESVKNKKIVLATAIAIVIALILSVTLGLLFSNLKGNGLTDGILQNVVDVDFGSNVGKGESVDPNDYDLKINTLTSEDTVRKFLNGTDGNTTAILTGNIYFGWGSIGNSAVFPENRVLDGNGYTITLTDSSTSLTNSAKCARGDTGAEMVDEDKNPGVDFYNGIFLAINKGTIKNVTFVLPKSYQISSGFWDNAWGVGGVCGKNEGTINNVKFIFADQVTFDAEFRNMPTRNGYGLRVVIGGICGNQSGTLSNVHVEMQGTSKITCESFNYSYYKNGFGADDPNVMHIAITGGVYGAIVGTEHRDTTFNLSFKGGENVTLEAKNTMRSVGSGLFHWESYRIFYCVGAIAGYSIEGVNGVMCDFRGNVSCPGYEISNQNNWRNYIDYFEKKQFMAFCGTPVNYYHTGIHDGDANSDKSPYIHMNNDPAYRNYFGNLFASSNIYVIPSTDGAIHGANDTANAANRIKNDTINRINVSEYRPSEGIGNVDFSFANDGTKGIVQISKTMPSDKSDIIWLAQAKGIVNGTEYGNLTKFGGYQSESKGKSINFNLTLSGDYQVAISSGHNFGQLTVPNQGKELTYTGNDYFEYIVKNAFVNKSSEIDKLTSGTPITMDRSDVTFKLYENDTVGVEVANFIYPIRQQNIIMQYNAAKGDGYNGVYAYVNSTYRFCYDATVFENLTMKPAKVTKDYDKTGGWKQKNTFSFVVSTASADPRDVIANFVDRIDVKRQNLNDANSGTETWKSFSGGQLKFDGTKVSFDVEETTEKDGAIFQVIGYKNGEAVIFNSYDTTTLEKLPHEFGSQSAPLKIDSILPTIDGIDKLTKLEQIEYHMNSEQKVSLIVQDKNSGLAASGAAKLYKQDWNATDVDNWTLVDEFPVDASGNVEFTFTEHKRYKIEITDAAGNVKGTEFTIKIDTTQPDIVNKDQIEYYVKKEDGSKDTSSSKFDNDPNNKFIASRSIFIDIPTNFGCAGGEVEYYVEGDKTGVTNTASKATAPTSGNIYTAEIKRTDKTTDTYVTYVFVLRSNARDEAGTHKQSDPIQTRIQLRVEQKTIHIYINDILVNVAEIASGIVKTYDGNDRYDISNFSLKFSDERAAIVQAELDEVNKDGFSYNVNNFNSYVEFVSATFSKVDHIATRPEDVAKNANEGKAAYYLIVELRALGTINFAIENEQDSNNYYVFEVGKSYQLQEGSISRTSVVNKIGINKKVVRESDINVLGGSKTYGDEIADITEYEKVEIKDGVLQGNDTIENLGLKFVWTNSVIGAKVDAGNYSFYAYIDNSENYKPESANLKFWADFRIYRKAIDKIYIEGELNYITCFDVPEVSAYFYGIEDEIVDNKVVGKKKVPLEIIYKNQDKEEVEFISGKRAEVGKYFYVILLEEDILTNYVNLSDPNMLIGHFYVVGDIVQEGKQFDLIDIDPVAPGIQVEYMNDFINFGSLIKFHEETLRDKLEILYGYAEAETSNIYEVGEYIVTLRVNADENDPEGNRYAPTTLIYNVFVVPTTVVLDSSVNYWNLPTYVDNDGKEHDGAIFDKEDHRLTMSNIAPELKEKLYNLLTDEEKAGIDSGATDLQEYFDFNFSYRVGIVNALEVKDAGIYKVALNIEGKRIKTISLSTEFNIIKRTINVEFDFDRILLEGGKDEQGQNLVSIDKEKLTITKVFDNHTLNLYVKDDFANEVAYYTDKVAGTDFGFSHQFAGKEIDIKNADVYIIEYKFENDIIKDPNVELVNARLRIEITPSIINLSLQDGEIDYNGELELLLTQEEINDLIDIHGILNPLAQIIFDTSKYSSEDVIAIAEEVEGVIRLGVKFINAGTYEIPIKLSNQDNNNNQLGRGKLKYIIHQKPLSSITLAAEYYEYGAKTEPKDLSKPSFEIEYNGQRVDIVLGETGLKQLQESHITDGQWHIDYYKGNNIVSEMINAGEYIARLTVTNKNVEAEPFDVKVVINKKRLGEYMGVFDYSTWYISKDGKEDYRLPNAEELEEGLMYRRTYHNPGTVIKKNDTYDEAYYSIRLRDEAELLAEGFTIVYKYNNIVADGVSTAGNHKVTAEIYNGDPNWEVKIVELWKTDSNGEFVYKDDDSDDVKNNLSSGNGTPSQQKVKEVVSFNIAKAELQTFVDELGNAAQLKSVVGPYNGKPYVAKFTETQMKLFEENMLSPVVGKNEFINAGEYSVIVTFKMMRADGTNDPNYDTAEMEASVTINPIVVKIFYEVDEKYMDKETGLIAEKYANNLKFGEAEPLTIKAYYYDRFGRKIYVKSLTIEIVKGSGEDIEFSSPKTEDNEDGTKTIIYNPNNYQVTAGIGDTNYTYDEEDLTNFLRFTIKNETKATNTALYILLAIVVVLAVATGLVILYMKKMFNPAVQEIDIDIE